MSKLDEFEAAKAHGEFAATRLLFSWLADDEQRKDLCACLTDACWVLPFQSRADAKTLGDEFSSFHQTVYLLAHPKHVAQALKDGSAFGNDPYRKLGSGTFMLGLDGQDHAAQRKFAEALLQVDPRDLEASNRFARHLAILSAFAWKAASVQPLKTGNFDLADLAEQVALRFTGFFFGFALGDHVLLEQTLRKAYRGLNYQILGRHFVSEPLTLPEASGAMAVLLVRTAALIDLYQRPVGTEQTEELGRIKEEGQDLKQAARGATSPGLDDFVPFLVRLAKAPGSWSGAELAVIAVGLMVGTIGNIQAAITMVVSEALRRREEDTSWEVFFPTPTPPSANDALDARAGKVRQVLRQNPPAAFLPRVALKADPLSTGDAGSSIPEGATVILIMGALAAAPADSTPDPIFADGSVHSCIGAHLATPVIVEAVAQVLSLEGLAEAFDPVTGSPRRIRKLWGFKCESYPLTFRREKRLIQHPLNVIMRVKSPVAVHAEALKTIIKYGSPSIELKLANSRHVHFAWFQFQENDSKLALMTVYDGEFDAYIRHFASQIGPLFDLLFEHIQDAPPRPTGKFPMEFVNTIRRYNIPPVVDYFFSAYPLITTNDVLMGAAAGAQP